MQTAVEELRQCNAISGQFGLALSDPQIQALLKHRFSALRETGRMEFGQGILPKLIYAFCDSPYISQMDYEDILLELQDIFYYFKNESMEQISDEELIAFMKSVFDGRAQGSLEYLSGTSLTELCRYAREGWDPRRDSGSGDLF